MMPEEEESRLNFYSKYNRVRGRQDIDTLYTLIDNNKPAEIHIVNLSLLRQDRQKRDVEPRYKNSRPVIPKDLFDKENDSNRSQQQDEINDKVEKLKRLERQFHQEMGRRERNLNKKRQFKEQQRKQPEKYSDEFINVVELKGSNTASLKSSELKSKKNHSEVQEVNVDEVQLDFQDYYQDVPDVPIRSSFKSNIPNKKEIREIMQKQRSKQKFVESVDEEGDRKADSIVIGRMNIGIKGTNNTEQAVQEPKKYIQVELAHSQSLNVFPGNSFDKQHFQQEGQKVPQAKKARNQFKQFKQSMGQDYSPARHFQSMQSNECFMNTDQHKQQNMQNSIEKGPMIDQAVHLRDSEVINKHELVQKNQNQIESSQNFYDDYDDSDPPNIPVANNTATEQGESIREEIEDRVGPIMNKSQYKQQNYNTGIQPSVFHSQTLPNSRLLHASREVQSIDYHPLQPPSDIGGAQMKLQNKKSSFKRLMAENRSNLVPRMAISTILNQHIKQVLIDFKNIAQPTRSPLHQSIISSDSPNANSPVSKKKKVNFKQKIAQKELDKSYNREVRPAFERDQSRIQKNRGLLLNFFAQN